MSTIFPYFKPYLLSAQMAYKDIFKAQSRKFMTTAATLVACGKRLKKSITDQGKLVLK